MHAIDVSKIDPTCYENARLVHNAQKFADLKASMKAQGLLEPIIVTPHPTKKELFGIAAGFSRYAAAVDLGWEKIDCVVKTLTAAQVEDVNLAENVQRADLTSAELCNRIGKWATDDVETGRKKQAAETIAKRAGLSKSSIDNYIRVYKAPFFKGWLDATIQHKPVPSYRDCLAILSQFPEKTIKDREEREKKQRDAFSRACVRAEKAAAPESEGGREGKRGDGSARTSVRAGCDLGAAYKAADKIVREIKAGTAGEGWKTSDVPMLEGIALALKWACKHKGASLPFDLK